LLVHVTDSVRNEEAYRAWMSEMQTRYDLTSQVAYEVPFESGKHHRYFVYDVYNFAPK
jgi:hypothetical protein